MSESILSMLIESYDKDQRLDILLKLVNQDHKTADNILWRWLYNIPIDMNDCFMNYQLNSLQPARLLASLHEHERYKFLKASHVSEQLSKMDGVVLFFTEASPNAFVSLSELIDRLDNIELLRHLTEDIKVNINDDQLYNKALNRWSEVVFNEQQKQMLHNFKVLNNVDDDSGLSDKLTTYAQMPSERSQLIEPMYSLNLICADFIEMEAKVTGNKNPESAEKSLSRMRASINQAMILTASKQLTQHTIDTLKHDIVLQASRLSNQSVVALKSTSYIMSSLLSGNYYGMWTSGYQFKQAFNEHFQNMRMQIK